MAKNKQSRLVRELLGLIDTGKVLQSLQSVPRYMIADYMGRHLREACKESSLHAYGGDPWYFDGVKYSPVEYTAFNNVIYDALMALGLPDGNMKKIWYISRICRDAAMEKELRPEAGVVTFGNCVFDMDAHAMRKFSPKTVSVTQMDYDYDPEAHCVRWQWFLDEVLPDKEMQKILQEFLGCVFIDRKRAKMEKMLVLLGPGANGKSVVHDVVRALLGEQNVTSFGLAELTQGYELKKNIATINGKRLNYASEISAQTFTHVNDQLKKLISGEPISARENYGRNFMACDIPLIMANANKLPPMRKEDLKAMSRRFVILPFNVEIPLERQNPMLARELCEELPGIFNWVMEGRERYIANGFTFSDMQRAETATTHYRMEGNPVAEFVIEKGYEPRRRDSMEQPKWVQVADLYEEYNEWALSKGKPGDIIGSKMDFGRVLTNDLGFRKGQKGGRVAYAIYSDKVRMAFQSKEEKETPRGVDLDNKPFYDVQGIKWVRSRDGIAKVLNLPIATIRDCINQGVFMGMVRQDGNAKLYNVEGCRIASAAYLREREAERKHKEGEKEDPKIWVMRGHFNKKMERFGEPYRKYGSRMMKQDTTGSGFVLVPDDWEYEKEIPLDKQSSLIKRRKKHQTLNIDMEQMGY